MDDIGVFKASYHMYDGIRFPDVREKLVTETFTLGCTLYKTGNIDKFNYGRDYFG